jgi:hypothetical protein
MLVSSLRFTLPLLVSLLLISGCGKDVSTPTPSQSVKTAKEKAPPSLPEAVPQAFTIGTPSTVYSDSALTKPYTELPAGTEVGIHGEGTKHYEIRVSSGGKLHTAYLEKSQVLIGTKEQAQTKIRLIGCTQSIGQPANAALIAGMLQDGKILPGYEVPVVEEEDFQDLGLEFVEAAPQDAALALDTPHLMEVIAPAARDAYVKVKDQRDGLVAAFYVRAGKTAAIDLPSGKFTTYFATGSKFSQGCGLFLEDFDVSKDETVLDFTDEGPAREVSYTLTPKFFPSGTEPSGTFTPKSISQDEFLK